MATTKALDEDPSPSLGLKTIGPPDAELTRPDPALHQDWLAAVAEFAAAGQYHHGSGLTPDGGAPVGSSPAWRPPDLVDPDRFAAFVDLQRSMVDESVARPLGLVPDSKLWITARDGAGRRRYLGAVSLRHELNDFLLEQGGHIGYGVRPAVAGRGIATRALGLTLDVAAGHGLDRVLVTAEPANPASLRVIERCGGVLEDRRGDVLRSWIDIGARSGAGPAASGRSAPVPDSDDGSG